MAKGTKTNRPAYTVRAKTGRKDGEGNDIFATVGAAWPFNSGEGFNVRIGMLPVNFDGTLMLIPQPRGKRIDLSERDFAIFEALHRHGPLPTHYLYEFTRHFGRHLTSFQHRLTKLANGTENGTAYLPRPRQQFASYNARCQPIIYDLAAPALAALGGRGKGAAL